MSHFREDLRTRRKRAGLTQQALAEKAGIDHSYVSKMETEEYYPTRDVALSLAAAFGLSGQDKFDFLLDARVASKEDWEELERFKTANDEAVKPKQQAIPTPLLTTTNPSLTLSDSLLDTTFNQIETDIESRHLSKEQMERLAAGLIEANKLLLNMIKPEHK